MSKKLRVFIITIEEPYFIPKTIFPLIFNPDIEIIGIAKMLPILGKKSILKFGLEVFNSFGIKILVQHVAFYAKCMINNILKRLSGNVSSLDLARFCKIKNIPLIPLSDVNSTSFINIIRNISPDIILSIAAMQIFRKDLIESSKIATINVHAALLPKYRGASPCFWNLLNNESFTGITCHFINEGLDTGDIIFQEKFKIAPDDSLFSLNSKIAVRTPIVLHNAFKLLKDPEFKGRPMDLSNSSYYSFPRRKDVSKFLKLKKKFY